MKDLEDYYRSLSIEEITEQIDTTTNKLKILLNVRVEKRKTLDYIQMKQKEQKEQLELN